MKGTAAPFLLDVVTYKSGLVLCSKYFGVKLKFDYFDNCKFYAFIPLIFNLSFANLGLGRS